MYAKWSLVKSHVSQSDLCLRISTNLEDFFSRHVEQMKRKREACSVNKAWMQEMHQIIME